MPELPEVETVRRGLLGFVVGKRIDRVEVSRDRTVRRTSAGELIAGLEGTTITGIGRRGKYLLADLDSGETLMIHLRMSGRVLVSPAGAPRPAHTHVVLHLDGDPPTEMWFIDPRTFGEMVVFDPANAAVELPDVARLGIDPITDGLSRAELGGLLRGRQRQIKALLLDQHVIAGIGNIYCDEILHRSGIHPLRTAASITPRQLTKLHEAIHHILTTAIKAGGSTLRDTQYVDVMGDGGSFQLDHRVYDRAGQRCVTCSKATIQRIVAAGRSTCFCPRCQR
ncbi:MAG TPA: bifunctional DNA-formamidopyrimidine glycosylase/DNA-(apurinic or apyrimidinic site) lyase [Ilumatobacteraceae bacterium]|nr:bifunctional DNA-formamidopyrimidine glycosylase/DNA-(apurinic or apyrimidinic site) lyase [Ilumatobacteraceae bacterium]